jgi:hypothetical protein
MLGPPVRILATAKHFAIDSNLLRAYNVPFVI